MQLLRFLVANQRASHLSELRLPSTSNGCVNCLVLDMFFCLHLFYNQSLFGSLWIQCARVLQRELTVPFSRLQPELRAF